MHLDKSIYRLYAIYQLVFKDIKYKVFFKFWIWIGFFFFRNILMKSRGEYLFSYNINNKFKYADCMYLGVEYAELCLTFNKQLLFLNDFKEDTVLNSIVCILFFSI